jgi:hypothetical protein
MSFPGHYASFVSVQIFQNHSRSLGHAEKRLFCDIAGNSGGLGYQFVYVL